MQDSEKQPKEETLEETPPAGSEPAGGNKPGIIEPGRSNGDKPKSPTRNPLKRLAALGNIYLIVFLAALLLAAGVIVAVAKLGGKNNTNKSDAAQSLTDKQIAALKGSTTVVGDAQQVLDIQGSSVFEGQVLLRNSLDVAGSIKVGGSLSLPAITVGGSSSFGTIQVNNTLSVNGSTILGQATVQKSLSVAGGLSVSGAFSAGQINVNNLQLTGDLQISRHIKLGGGIPSRSGGSALGAGGTASLNGSDTAGTITINTGGSPPAGCFVTVNFVNHFNSTPHVIISPSNSRAGSLQYYANRSASSFSVCTNNAPAAGNTYLFDYMVID
jgi:cytoskeletal protein CcmA (bactofilin family)